MIEGHLQLEPESRSRTYAPLFAGVIVQILLSGALGGMAFLKENQLFWRNAGGYPLFLRDCVHYTFHPLLIVSSMHLLRVFLLGAQAIRTSQHQRFILVMLAVLCAVQGSITAFVIANNIDNLVEGRPLHWHPDRDEGP